MASSSHEPVLPPQAFDFGLSAPSANKRYPAAPGSQRLQTINETGGNAPPIPPKSILRNSVSQTSLMPSQPPPPATRSVPSPDSPRSLPGARGTSAETAASTRTAPPAYSWMPDSFSSEDGREPIEGEKLAALRRSDRQGKRRARGGWTRLAILVAALVVIIGLAVGLGVGLTLGRSKSSVTEPPAASNSSSSTSGGPQFPAGTFSLVTALERQSTNCTSNPATWSCPPYSVLNSSDASAQSSSQAVLSWVISATSSQYANINTGSTPDDGIPANLTISSTDNPFSISFTNQSLTYIASASNSSSPRLTFNMTLPKFTFPSTNLTSSNTRSKCYFNQTVLTGTLYLSAGRNYPTGDAVPQTGYQLWPYAVEVSQTSPGGADSPACYELDGGVVGSRIMSGLTPQSTSSQCLCDYKNF